MIRYICCLLLLLSPLDTMALKAPDIKKEKMFVASKLVIDALPVNGDIELSRDSYIRIKFLGDDTVLSKINIEHKNNVLHLTGGDTDSNSLARVKVSIPVDTEIDMNIVGKREWEIDYIGAASQFILTGESELDIEQINSPKLDLTLLGENEVEIKKGKVKFIKAEITGDNDLEALADINSLNLKLVGSNEVRLHSVGQINYVQNIGQNNVKIKKYIN